MFLSGTQKFSARSLVCSPSEQGSQRFHLRDCRHRPYSDRCRDRFAAAVPQTGCEGLGVFPEGKLLSSADPPQDSPCNGQPWCSAMPVPLPDDSGTIPLFDTISWLKSLILIKKTPPDGVVVSMISGIGNHENPSHYDLHIKNFNSNKLKFLIEYQYNTRPNTNGCFEDCHAV